jgi:hypothetical protein
LNQSFRIHSHKERGNSFAEQNLEGRTPNLETLREPPENGTWETFAFVSERSD